jgi:DNA-binding MarR family transcriptional regulator
MLSSRPPTKTPTVPVSPRAVDLAAALRGAVTRFTRRLRHERPATDLTISQLSALAALEAAGSMTPGDLAAAERVRPPSMTRTVAALERAGLVGRSAHPTDRRQAVLSATPAGTALVRANRRAREAWLAGRLATLSAAERRVLAEAAALLDRMAHS